MAVKRSKKTSKSKAPAEAYEQTMLAEGAPLALDLLGLGSTIGDIIRGKPRKTAKKRRLKKKARSKVKMSRKTPRAKKAKKGKKKAVRKTRGRK